LLHFQGVFEGEGEGKSEGGLQEAQGKAAAG